MEVTNDSYYQNGNIKSKETYVNGIRHGIQLMYHDNGALEYMTHYDKGVINSVCRHWAKSGRIIKEYTVVNGLLHGSYVEWDEYGKLISISSYNEGKLIEKKII